MGGRAQNTPLEAQKSRLPLLFPPLSPGPPSTLPSSGLSWFGLGFLWVKWPDGRSTLYGVRHRSCAPSCISLPVPARSERGSQGRGRRWQRQLPAAAAAPGVSPRPHDAPAGLTSQWPVGGGDGRARPGQGSRREGRELGPRRLRGARLRNQARRRLTGQGSSAGSPRRGRPRAPPPPRRPPPSLTCAARAIASFAAKAPQSCSRPARQPRPRAEHPPPWENVLRRPRCTSTLAEPAASRLAQSPGMPAPEELPPRRARAVRPPTQPVTCRASSWSAESSPPADFATVP